MREGKYPFQAPTGYLDTGSIKEVDPHYRGTLRMIFELFVTGSWSYEALARWANAQGLRQRPRRAARSADQLANAMPNLNPRIARPLTHKTIEAMLKNPFYAGKTVWHGEMFDAVHEPVITLDTFHAVQEVLAGRGRTRLAPMDEGAEPYVYRRMIRCACGRAFSPYTKKGHRYYTVSCRRSCDNTVRNLSERRVDSLVASLMERLSLTGAELTALVERTHEGLDALRAKAEQRRVKIRNALQEAARDLKYLDENKVLLLRGGTMTPDEHLSRVGRLRAKEAKLQAELDVPDPELEEIADGVGEFLELLNCAKSTYKTAPATIRRQLVEEVLLELRLEHGSVAEIRAKPGFDVLLKRGWLHGGGRSRN